MDSASNNGSGITGRATTLLLTAVVGISLIGFLVGIEDGVPRPDADARPAPPVVVDAGTGEVLPAMSYAEIRDRRIGPTRQRRYSLDQIPQPEHDLFAEFTPDPLAKEVSLQTRSQRRAYNGAPPVISHSVDQLSSESCLACHGEGLRIENRDARRLPHPYLANCTQCHAPPAPPPFVSDVFAVNTFSGVAAPFEGERAWPGAPPTIPHTTWMRDNCLACHGPGGWAGMETTHPWQLNCLQCHAPSAVLDQSPTLAGATFLPPPDVVER